jgi:RsiW-degrading membrane proteinase PrsW (M82 family)
MYLLALALAPVLIILFYIYVRDKYEKEPLSLLVKSLVIGALISIPVIFVESMLSKIWNGELGIMNAGYRAFVVAGFTEELFKFAVLYWLIWKHKEFDEKFDGIVYAVFISLGFAAIENILYVYEYGANIGYLRAFTAVPAHAVFGVVMGFYFALAKFSKKYNSYFLIKALVIPVLLHGFYDFILMSDHPYLMFLFIPYLIWLLYFARKKIIHLDN